MEPIRCCIACRAKKTKENFFRIVANDEKKAILDKKQNSNSRGIYICRDKKCIENALKTITKNKLKLKINVDNQSLVEVLKELGEEIWEN